ncbi:NADPH:quinone reductase-like Zn-dependent oxidoreductase [Actinoplanes tereljensis]|uniref:NADPH:quinone reductase n=1 Tax=Paractinoplanes tereljensis TaxID=571912 RepID=A0A919NN09_9ACTN|nr:NADP-dependent oxidoreductase [Actinoplanes tereljensis]GIF20924.1 NADPH:quinone reductase [Actinoplanes tereljensis]
MPQAYAFTALGGPEVESFLDVPKPSPGPGQVLIKVRAAGVNPVDWKKRTGYRPQGAPEPSVPAVFGGEAAGVVEQVGPGVTDFRPGDEVFGQTVAGGYAEYALLPAQLTARRPSVVSFEDAATLPIAAATAHDALVQLDLPPGSTLLIIGVGGGVGVGAAQIARLHEINVIGTASAAKKDFVELLEAVPVEYGEGVADRVRAAAPEGIDAILDLIGGPELEELAELLDDRTKLVSAADRATVARLGGAPVERARTRAVLEQVATWVADGVLNPRVVEVFTLAEARQALRRVEDGHARGKVVITNPA